MKDNYTFPVIIDYSEEDYINLLFPDFEIAITCADHNDDYILIAQEYLALVIRDYEEQNKEIPKASKVESIKTDNNQTIIYVNIWMPYHRSTIKETYIKKTLTIPVWLDILAKNNNLNFSSILVNGLKRELNIK
jgi:antitoxin HicB